MVLKFCHPDPDFLPRCSGHGCVCASPLRSETNLSNNPLSPFCHPERSRISYLTALTGDHACGSQ
jgi:hypothetical protein